MAKKISRRKFLFFSAGALLATVASFFTFSGYSLMGMDRKKRSFLKNDKLKTIKPDYPGNEMVNGRFTGHNNMPRNMFSKVIKWRFSANPQAKEKRNDPFRLTVHNSDSIFDIKDDAVIWLGNAGFLVRLDGINFLMDPCYGNPPLVKRYAPPPGSATDIRNINYLLVSHNHYDHLDRKSIGSIPGQKTRTLVPLELGRTVRRFNSRLIIEEAAWYQQYTTGTGEPEVYLMPARHWSRRTVGDINKTLWGSFIIKGTKKTIYFGGDTAYGPHFSEIKEYFPEIDICLMPIGAYKPPYIMKSNHLSPAEAVDAFHDLGGKVFIPMHYGTFDLSDEPPGEPVRMVQDMNAKGLIKGETRFLEIGEVWHL